MVCTMRSLVLSDNALNSVAASARRPSPSAAAAIRDEVASLSLAVAEKAVAGAVDAKAHKKLVEQYIAELGALRP